MNPSLVRSPSLEKVSFGRSRRNWTIPPRYLSSIVSFRTMTLIASISTATTDHPSPSLEPGDDQEGR
ncbi:MAG: hypothetical protein WD314_02145, partial [Trueperaceae bacterium]